MYQFDFITNREPESHKGFYGHALLVAGSYGKMGAAVLAARACLRAGVGLLTVHIPQCGVGIMQTAVPEAMLSIDSDERHFATLPSDLDRYSAIAVGPGIGVDEATQSALLALLEKRLPEGQRLVLDADALNILARHPESMHLVSGGVITPHSAEYQRLFGDADPRQMSEMHNVCIVKKAHRSVVYVPGREPVVNNTGNAGMATAGSGDVLTGLMLGLQSQAAVYPSHAGTSEVPVGDVAAFAVYVHGRAGDIAAQRLSQASLVASDIVEHIPEVLR